jgi:hypothetical protein
MKKIPVVIPFTFAFLFILFSWAACNKSSSNGGGSGGPSATVKLITQATWKYDTSGIDLNHDGSPDIGDTSITPCEKDNIYTFKTDSTGTMDEGPTKCHVADPQTVPFHWKLTNNESVFTSDVNPILAGGVNILSITSTKFVVYKDSTVTGFSVRYVLSLKH